MPAPAPITFAPRRGAILMCDFGVDPNEPWPTLFRPVGVMPEMTKLRRAVVVSPDSFNARQRTGFSHYGPGLCIVVPVSTTKTVPPNPAHVPLLATNYRAITRDGWAKCDLPYTVSHDRLYRPRVGGKFVSDFVSRPDMALIEASLRLTLGL